MTDIYLTITLFRNLANVPDKWYKNSEESARSQVHSVHIDVEPTLLGRVPPVHASLPVVLSLRVHLHRIVI
jgi:hypothetical protein